ncbi:MAG: hypothetical protein FJ295_18920 [Planctomycetes bacterium]|nr:hypothetical protein [Planctomycetota bacterium]
MSRRLGREFVVASFCLALSISGCSCEGPPVKKTSGTSGSTGSADKKIDDHEHHDHAHMHGPHGGHVLELGHEDYHAEWMEDDASGRITVILLDDKVEKEVAIDDAEIEIRTKVAGEEKSFKLPSAGEADKPSARFETEDKTLLAILEAAGKDGTEAQLLVRIKGKEYAGNFAPHEH